MTELRAVSNRLLENYVRRYESGGVQRRPRLRFVDAEGRACIVGAMADVDSSREFAESDHFRSFRSGPLVRISRMFEEGRVSAAEVYDACLLELARRSDAGVGSEDTRRREAATV